MRIVSLESNNVKRLRAVAITPTGNVVQITGRNGHGKSSVLDSIYMALAGKRSLPPRPVRSGEESAVISLDLGDIKVVRKIAADGRTEVVVEATSGARFPSPQRLLDDLLGELTFDPLKFSIAEPKAQLETLRRLVKLDVDIDALDELNARDYDARTDANRQARSLAERITTLHAGLKSDMDVTPVDISALTQRMAEASEHNAAIERDVAARSEADRLVTLLRADAEGVRRQIQELQRSLARKEEQIALLDDRIAQRRPLNRTIELGSLREEINSAVRENSFREQQARQRALYEAAVTDAASVRAVSDGLTASIEARTKRKAEAIAAAKMPVDGLSFGDGMVLYRGIPLEQASSAEQLRVSFAVAMAMNPKLKIVLVRDGSLLDEDNLALVAQMAEEHEYQVWIERVDSSGKVGIVLEDGEVVAVNGAAAEEVALVE